MCLLIGTGFQVSDVAYKPLVFFFLDIHSNLINMLSQSPAKMVIVETEIARYHAMFVTRKCNGYQINCSVLGLSWKKKIKPVVFKIHGFVVLGPT